MSPRWTRREALAAAGAALVAGCSGAPSATESPGSTPPESPPPTGSSPPTATGPPSPTRTADPADGEPATPVENTFTPREWSAPTDAPTRAVRTNVLVENLEVPWDVSVAPDGDLFVTERVGRVSRFASGELEQVLAPEDAIDAGSVEPGSTARPWWVSGGEGGTLGVAIHPGYPEQSWLYVYYTADADGGRVNRLSRFDVDAADPAGTEERLIDGVPANNFHNGGRVTFGPRGHLWVTTGDAGQEETARDPAALTGKVLRLTPDGSAAPDNPDLGGGADPRVFTYGHRNPQGLGFLPDGTVLASEHGPTGHDEVNRLVAGADYGWPDVRTEEPRYADAEGVHPPLANTGRGGAWAPTGSLFYTGDAVAGWRNRLLVGGLVSQQLVVATLTPPDAEPPPVEWGRRFDEEWTDDAFTATAHPVLEDELGRIRHVEQGLDGELYAITSNRDGRAGEGFPRDRDDVLVRLEPE